MPGRTAHAPGQRHIEEQRKKRRIGAGTAFTKPVSWCPPSHPRAHGAWHLQAACQACGLYPGVVSGLCPQRSRRRLRHPPLLRTRRGRRRRGARRGWVTASLSSVASTAGIASAQTAALRISCPASGATGGRRPSTPPNASCASNQTQQLGRLPTRRTGCGTPSPGCPRRGDRGKTWV